MQIKNKKIKGRFVVHPFALFSFLVALTFLLLVEIAHAHVQEISFLGQSVEQAPLELADSPWPTFRGNLKNTGLSPYNTSYVDGTVKWVFKADDDFESSPAIGADGTIYLGSHKNKLYAINPDGTLKWKFDAGEPVYDPGYDVWKGILSTPAIEKDGTIYITSLSNFLFAVNPDGTEKWKFPMITSTDTWSSPTIGKDGTIYVGSARGEGRGGSIYAIKRDGKEKWEFEAESDVFPTPAIGDDGTIYSGSGATGNFYAINPDGGLKWKINTGKHIESSAAIGKDGTVYVGSWNNYFYAFAPDGKKKWDFLTRGDGIVSSPAIDKDGTIYFAANDGNLYALNPDGTKKWKYLLGDFKETSSSPTIGADGTIYVGSPVGFFAINPDGTKKWSHNANVGGISASPTIGKDGTVYVSTYSGELYAFSGAAISSDEKDQSLEKNPLQETETQIYENLESDIDRWDLGPGWSVNSEGENKFLQGTQHTFATAYLGGVVNKLNLRFRILQGSIHFNIRSKSTADGLNRYFIGFNEGSTYISKQMGSNFQQLENGEGFLINQWHTLKIEIIQDTIQVFLDDKRVLFTQDRDILQEGGISFETHDHSVAYIEDVQVETQIPKTRELKAPYLFPDGEHRGDLTLEGRDLLVLENGNFEQFGNIYLKDSSRLVIRNSVFKISRHERLLNHWGIYLEDVSYLEIENSKLEPGQEALFVIDARDMARVTMKNAPTKIHLFGIGGNAKSVVENSEIVFDIGGLVGAYEKGDVKIVDSKIGAVNLNIPSGATLEATGLGTGIFKRWNLHENTNVSGINYNITLINTELVGDTIGPGPFERGWPIFISSDANVRIENSELRKVVIELQDEKAEFANFSLEKPTSFNYKNISLKNVVVKGQWGIFPHGSSDIVVRDSNAFWTFIFDNSTLKLINTHMNEFDPRDFYGEIIFENSTWDTAAEIIGNNNFTISGSLEIDEIGGFSWENSKVRRIYDLVGKPDSELTLRKDGEVVWQGKTDENNEATFSLTFNDTTFDDSWTIGDNFGNENEVTFFSKTPIDIQQSAASEFIQKTEPKSPPDTLKLLVPVLIVLIIFFLFFWKKHVGKKKVLLLTVLLFIAGCVQPATPSQAVVCNKPYIVVGTSCCLDQNDNAICDSDEQGEGPGASAPGYTPDMLESFPLETCGNYEWPPDCNYIPVEEARELCNKCTGQNAQPAIALPVLPRINSSHVKGLYFSSLVSGHGNSIADPVRLKDDGVNTIAFTVEYKVDANGRRIDTDDLDNRVISIIRKYKNEGFAIFLIPTLRYMPRGMGEPLGIPESLQDDPAFFEGLNEFVLHTADIAERERVEYFAPLDEPDYRLGPLRSINWSRQILPEVRTRFSGKIVYKGGFSPPFEISLVNLSGYDIAGTTIVVLDIYDENEYREMARKQIDDLEAVRKRDGVPEIWVSGFGPVETIRNPIDENQKADIYRIIFEEADGKVTGQMPWENPNNLLRDTPAEKEIKKWFTERIE